MPVYPVPAPGASCASPGCRYRDRGRAYPSDTTDEQWQVLLPEVKAVMAELLQVSGRPMTHDLRAMLGAVFYVVKNGIEWRAPRREEDQRAGTSRSTSKAGCWRSWSPAPRSATAPGRRIPRRSRGSGIRARHSASPGTHVTAGTGRAQPVATSPASASLLRQAHSPRATSCRNTCPLPPSTASACSTRSPAPPAEHHGYPNRPDPLTVSYPVTCTLRNSTRRRVSETAMLPKEETSTTGRCSAGHAISVGVQAFGLQYK